jgi:hypothetical protein
MQRTFSRSKAMLAAGDLRRAFDMDLRALLGHARLLGRERPGGAGRQQVPLVNEVFNDLQRLTSGVRISILPERCELNYTDHSVASC